MTEHIESKPGDFPPKLRQLLEDRGHFDSTPEERARDFDRFVGSGRRPKMTVDEMDRDHTYQTCIDIYTEERAGTSGRLALANMAQFAVEHGLGSYEGAAKVLAEYFAGRGTNNE